MTRGNRFDDAKVGALLERFDEVVPEGVRWLFDLEWDGGDAWGSLMSHYFAVNDVLWAAGATHLCDESYSPGMGGPELEASPSCEYWDEYERDALTIDQLGALNKAFGVLCHGLKLLGKDY